MITVTVFINGNPIISRSAKNVSGKREGVNNYICDTGDTIVHRYEDGAIELAKKMLDTVIEV